jgi:hypothetical protein
VSERANETDRANVSVLAADGVSALPLVDSDNIGDIV